MTENPTPDDSAPTDPSAAPRKEGMSTGAKVLFGCLGLAFLGAVGLAVVVFVGGVALWRNVGSPMVERVEDQQAATETLQRIEEEYPFEPPEDGVVSEDRLERFLMVTTEAWEDIGVWAGDLEALSESTSAPGDRGAVEQLGDLATGARAIGGLMQSRASLAEALDQHDMSLAEYIWTGLTLSRAAEAEDGRRSAEGVPEENVELARRHSGRLPELGSDEHNDAGAVLGVATMWGLTELSTWQAMGLDTLMAR
jgi:hypothetical protein